MGNTMQLLQFEAWRNCTVVTTYSCMICSLTLLELAMYSRIGFSPFLAPFVGTDSGACTTIYFSYQAVFDSVDDQ